MSFFTEVGFDPSDVQILRAVTRPDASVKGVVVMPAPDFVARIPPEIRARVYEVLLLSSENFPQAAAYRFFGRNKDQWLHEVSPEFRALVDPLIYQAGNFMVFADIDLIRGRIGRGPELQMLIKRLLAQSTLMISLRVESDEELDELVEYWGRGGRKTDIRPLLESVAETDATGHMVDVIHLLPEMARRLLYRYPKVKLEDLQKPQLANCFWSALNFFNDQPDDSLLDPAVAVKRLSTDYYMVEDKLQLGDIVAFSDRDHNVFHVAVYIASDIVFTKNGYYSLAPWTLLPMERLKGHFPAYANDWHVTYYRRKDF
jgi:hypothetical protein